MRIPALGLLLALLLASLAAAGSDSRIVEAVKSGDHAAIRALLKEHTDVNSPQADGTTALIWAAQRDDAEAVDLLIRAGANGNAKNDYGITALSVACSNRNAAIVEKLLNAGADANASLPTGETVLMTCARTGALDAVKLLLAHGANVNAKENKRGQTALMWAVAEKHLEVAPALIEHGADIHARTKGGFTPLLFAARTGNLEFAKILLGAGADVNESTPDDGSALVVASAGGYEALAMYLLDHGANPNASDAYGVTPLHLTAQRGLANLSAIVYSSSRLPPPNLSPLELYLHRLPPPDMPELAKVLLAHGANPNARITKDYGAGRKPTRGFAQMTLVGATPFFLAAAAADVGLMRIFSAAGADPLLEANGGTTPLMVAAGMGRVQDFLEGEEKSVLEAVKLAVELGADVNAANIRGQTALHAAAYTGADTIIQFLADKGANVSAKDSIGETPWSIAEAFVQRPNDKGGVRVHESTAALILKLGGTPITQQDIVPYTMGDRVGNEIRYMIVGEVGCGGVATSRAKARGCTD